jgi:hypothetical protein
MLQQHFAAVAKAHRDNINRVAAAYSFDWAHLVEALLVVCVAAGQREAMQRSRAGRLQLDNSCSIRLCHIILPLYSFILL